MYNINIEQMTSNLMNTEEHGSTYRPLQKRLMINFTKEACGRGGEVKFLKYSEWNYNNYFGIMERRWFDMKTLEKYAHGMSPHFFLFAMDSLHSLAYLWACEDGLWRRHFNIIKKCGQKVSKKGDVYYEKQTESVNNS